MNILITGGSGFIGQYLCRRLAAHGHVLTVLSRREKKARKVLPAETRIITDLDDIADDTQIDAIVNLCGESLFSRRWTDKRKEVLLASRIGVTHKLVALAERLTTTPAVMVSGSAVGFYGNAGDATLTEDSSARKKDFGYCLCDAWEQAARPVARKGVRLCLIRTGVVLGRDGGMLSRLLPAYKMGVGAMIGDGSQWVSWIHIDDMVAILVRAIETPGVEGVFNATAPHPVTQRQFHQTVAKTVRRPAFFRVPGRLLRATLGEQADVLLGGQKAFPQRLEQQGFMFRYPEIEKAVGHITSPLGPS